jgi:hypothetical protein
MVGDTVAEGVWLAEPVGVGEMVGVRLALTDAVILGL